MILVSIGANLPGPDGAPPLETCRRAAAALDALPGLRLRGLSRWFVTAPVLPARTSPAARQPAYVNAVAHLVVEHGGTIDPAVLLQRLMALEAVAGRVRGAPNAPRVLDLDIVAMGELVRRAPIRCCRIRAPMNGRSSWCRWPNSRRGGYIRCWVKASRR